MGGRAVKPRLMLVVTDDWYLWSHRIGLAEAARDAGYEVTVATTVRDHGERIRALGVDLVHVDFARGRLSPWANLRTACALREVYRSRAPHLVHHVAIKPIVLGSLAAARVRAPTPAQTRPRPQKTPAVVNALAGLGTALASDHVKARLARPALRVALAWAMRRPGSRTIVQNAEDARFVESLGASRERITLLPGAGVDVRVFQPRPEPSGPIRVTMVSRLLRDKGVREFCEAAALVRRARKDIVFTLVGTPDEGNPTSVLEEELRSWTADGLVEWQGRREDVADVLAASHVAMLPTYYGEGAPKTLIEAAACGRAIIATDVPGCRTVVRHGGNGLLVPARDARALAEAALALAEDPARRAAMGAEGRRRAETEFASDLIHAETLKVYERSLAAAR